MVWTFGQALGPFLVSLVDRVAKYGYFGHLNFLAIPIVNLGS